MYLTPSQQTVVDILGATEFDVSRNEHVLPAMADKVLLHRTGLSKRELVRALGGLIKQGSVRQRVHRSGTVLYKLADAEDAKWSGSAMVGQPRALAGR